MADSEKRRQQRGQDESPGDKDTNQNPLRAAWDWYLNQLREQPLLTKAITSGIISGLGPVVKLALLRQPKGQPRPAFPWRQVFAFATFGFAVTGPVTHTFYALLEQNIPRSKHAWVARLLIDRLCFAPPFLFLFFMGVNILEGHSPRAAFRLLRQRYWPALKDNWRVWTVTQFINLKYVPLNYRVLFANIVALGWNAYLAL
eukprot:m.10363 g.10363  ORF g.10363 m.10363 type:complete len:201 (+) comp5881_c0_seq2:106-708(+)